MKCPRCEGTLQGGAFGEVPVHMCDGCASVLVDIMRNIPMLGQLAEGLTQADLDGPIELHEDDGEIRNCPKCAKPMERFDYMGSGVVTLDRCSPDRLLFLDVEEVTAAAILLTRTRGRLDQRRAENAAHVKGIEEAGDRAMARMRRGMRHRFNR